MRAYFYQYQKEVCNMNHSANKCIECSVRQCAHHAGDSNYCVLDKVSIGTHEPNPTMTECVDCLSFIKR